MKTPVELQWQANASANTRGYLVERAFQTSGPWEVLTPRGTTARQYTDREARPGSTLFYRLRAIGPRGDVGEPCLPLPVNVRGEVPAAPAGLAAEVGHSRVRLNWQMVAGAAAYHVERRAGESRAWSRLTSTATPETRYDDVYGGSPGGRFEYRVYAVAPDEQTGELGPALAVALPDTTPPPPPPITASSGENGRVRLAFRAAAPEADTALVLVLRGAGAEEPGLVIGDPITVGKGEFIDSWVEAGKRYVYRLVAVDAAGNRGDPGVAVQVRVGAPPLAVPGRPEARYLAEPFAHVKLTFAAPPKGLRVLVEAGEGKGEGKGEGEHWRPAAGPVVGGEAIDPAPSRATPRYRLRYQSGNGGQGEASAEVVVGVP
ncbi:MAG: fibronectin type III domain-containing protein [Pseudomonadota bacterium]|nr:fibronectin type III domain-containing protein [Pseudomonadota bacterium]